MRIMLAASIIAAFVTTPALAGTDWGKVCASYYLTPGTAEFKDCVAKMTEADKATNGTLMQGNANRTSPDAASQRAQTQSDIDKQRYAMQAQMNRQMQEAKLSSSNCVTTVHGSNTSTVCPAQQSGSTQQAQWTQQRSQPQQEQWSQNQQKKGDSAPQQRRINLIGMWSTGTPQNGTAFAFNPDGTYVNVAGFNGSLQRLWGRYRATPVSDATVRIDFQLMGWAPSQMCAQVIGGARACRAYSPLYSKTATLNFTSTLSFEAQGTQFHRDPSPYLLQIRVPQVMERQVAGMGGIRQPVMPTLHPYQTPGGAGSVGAMRYDDEHEQPYRICGVNNGSVYTDQNGVQHCTN